MSGVCRDNVSTGPHALPRLARALPLGASQARWQLVTPAAEKTLARLPWTHTEQCLLPNRLGAVELGAGATFSE